MFSRENLKLAGVAVFCLLVAWAGPSIAHGVHAKFAHNADKVDGKHAVGAGASLARARGKLVTHDSTGRIPAKFSTPASSLVHTHGASGWQIYNLAPPTTFFLDPRGTLVSGDGWVQIPLDAPRGVAGGTYGLAQLELCFKTNGPGVINFVAIDSTQPSAVNGSERIFSDETDRTSATPLCATLTVGKRVPFGAGMFVQATGGGTITLYSVRSTWSLASANVAPRAVTKRETRP